MARTAGLCGFLACPAGVLEHRAVRPFDGPLCLRQLVLEPHVLCFQILVALFGAFQPPFDLMVVQSQRVALPADTGELERGAVQRRRRDLERVRAHTNAPSLDATWTLNVTDVPVIVHAARTFASIGRGNAKMSLPTVDRAGNVTLVVHVDPSGLSCTVTVTVAAVTAVTSTFATWARATVVVPVPFPVATRAWEAASVC